MAVQRKRVRRQKASKSTRGDCVSLPFPRYNDSLFTLGVWVGVTGQAAMRRAARLRSYTRGNTRKNHSLHFSCRAGFASCPHGCKSAFMTARRSSFRAAACRVMVSAELPRFREIIIYYRVRISTHICQARASNYQSISYAFVIAKLKTSLQ